MKNIMQNELNILSLRPSCTLRAISGHSFGANESANLSFYLGQNVNCKHDVNIVSGDVKFPVRHPDRLGLVKEV